ncbi:hypothetical protein AHF37_10684 [Paragonimus kellicotti]|nr:hypothetical protein AHF37_10684 [Paragonimus kellicotti]
MNSITGKQRTVQFNHQSSPRRSQNTDDGDSTVLGSLASSCGANTKSAASLKSPTSGHLTAVEQQHGPCEVIPIAGSVWVSDQAKDSGEYPYAARLLPSRAIVAAGSGFHEVRVIGRDTLLPIARIPMDSVVQSMDTILDGRYIGVGCSSGTVSLIGMA